MPGRTAASAILQALDKRRKSTLGPAQSAGRKSALCSAPMRGLLRLRFWWGLGRARLPAAHVSWWLHRDQRVSKLSANWASPLGDAAGEFAEPGWVSRERWDW